MTSVEIYHIGRVYIYVIGLGLSDGLVVHYKSECGAIRKINSLQVLGGGQEFSILVELELDVHSLEVGLEEY